MTPKKNDSTPSQPGQGINAPILAILREVQNGGAPVPMIVLDQGQSYKGLIQQFDALENGTPGQEILNSLREAPGTIVYARSSAAGLAGLSKEQLDRMVPSFRNRFFLKAGPAPQ